MFAKTESPRIFGICSKEGHMEKQQPTKANTQNTESRKSNAHSSPPHPLPSGKGSPEHSLPLSPAKAGCQHEQAPSPALKSRNVIPGKSSWGQRLVSSPSLPWGMGDLPQGHSHRHMAAFTPACYRVQVSCCDRAAPPLALCRRLEGQEKQAGPAPEAQWLCRGLTRASRES